MTDLEIIGVAFSNYVRSVRMLCEEKAVPYRHVSARPHSPEVLAIHPAGQIPVLRHGDLTLFETSAIATYIDKAFPGPRLIPDDAVGAAKVTQWVSYGNAKVDRWIMREFVVPSAFFDKAKGPDTVRIEAAIPEMEKCCAALDAQLAKSAHLAGPDLTYADLHVLPMIMTVQAFPHGKEMVPRYKALSAWAARLSQRPAYTNTAPPPRA